MLLPPTGIIDGSVLTAVGELLMFGVIAQIPRILDAVRNGKSFKFQKGIHLLKSLPMGRKKMTEIELTLLQLGLMVMNHRAKLFTSNKQ